MQARDLETLLLTFTSTSEGFLYDPHQSITGQSSFIQRIGSTSSLPSDAVLFSFAPLSASPKIDFLFDFTRTREREDFRYHFDYKYIINGADGLAFIYPFSDNRPPFSDFIAGEKVNPLTRKVRLLFSKLNQRTLIESFSLLSRKQVLPEEKKQSLHAKGFVIRASSQSVNKTIRIEYSLPDRSKSYFTVSNSNKLYGYEFIRELSPDSFDVPKQVSLENNYFVTTHFSSLQKQSVATDNEWFRELATFNYQKLIIDKTDYYQRLKTYLLHINRTPFQEQNYPLESIRSWLFESFGTLSTNKKVHCHLANGDLTQCSIIPGDKPCIPYWHHFMETAPLLFDYFHFKIREKAIVRKKQAETLFNEIITEDTPVFLQQQEKQFYLRLYVLMAAAEYLLYDHKDEQSTTPLSDFIYFFSIQDRYQKSSTCKADFISYLINSSKAKHYRLLGVLNDGSTPVSITNRSSLQFLIEKKDLPFYRKLISRFPTIKNISKHHKPGNCSILLQFNNNESLTIHLNSKIRQKGTRYISEGNFLLPKNIIWSQNIKLPVVEYQWMYIWFSHVINKSSIPQKLVRQFRSLSPASRSVIHQYFYNNYGFRSEDLLLTSHPRIRSALQERIRFFQINPVLSFPARIIEHLIFLFKDRAQQLSKTLPF